MIDSYDRAEHAKTDKVVTNVLSFKRQIFYQSTVKSGVCTIVSFNTLTRQKIFSEYNASRFFPVVNPCYCEKADMRGDTDIFLSK